MSDAVFTIIDEIFPQSRMYLLSTFMDLLFNSAAAMSER